MSKGTAATIQFHPGTSGWTHGGFAYHATLAGQKHIAIPAAQVRVGVTNILIKFSGLFVQKYHQAQRDQHHGHILHGVGTQA